MNEEFKKQVSSNSKLEAFLKFKAKNLNFTNQKCFLSDPNNLKLTSPIKDFV